MSKHFENDPLHQIDEMDEFTHIRRLPRIRHAPDARHFPYRSSRVGDPAGAKSFELWLKECLAAFVPLFLRIEPGQFPGAASMGKILEKHGYTMKKETFIEQSI